MKNENNRWYLSSDFWGSLAFCVIVVLLMWLYLILTPDQTSAECDFGNVEMKGE